MKLEEMVDFWIKSATEDILTAESLFATKRYLPCLFYCHLFIEKIIKAIIVAKTDQNAPYGHKLSRLAKLTGINFNTDQLNLLDDLTAFNIKARYEDYKFQLYKKATKQYTENYFLKSRELYQWLKKQL